MLLVLSACGPAKEPGTLGSIAGYAGLVAADEPRAVLVAQDVLTSGGTAADAAVALYFAMAVTRPSSASLGGGGACVVYDQPKKTVEALDFLPRAPKSQAANAERPSAIPGGPRGIYALHAKHGKLRWEQLLAPAEQMARLGTPVSRAFANDIARVAAGLFQDPGAQRVFLKNGRPASEGDALTQLDLATVLARLRLQGPGDFYAGATARALVEAYASAGAPLTLEDLRDYNPQWVAPISVAYGNDTAYFAPPPASAGLVEAQMWSMLVAKDRYQDAKPEERVHLLAETAQRAFAERARWLTPGGMSAESVDGLVAPAKIAQLMASYDPAKHAPIPGASEPVADLLGNTGFVVADQNGSAVACTLGNNGLFGVGRVAPGTGIVIAAMPRDKQAGPYAVGPMLAINKPTNELRFAAAAEGGPTAPTALIQVAAQTLLAERPVRESVEGPRIHHGGNPDAVIVENIDGAPQAAFEARGHRIGKSAMPSRVNALVCRSGAPSAQRCQAATDPRGNGYAITVGK